MNLIVDFDVYNAIKDIQEDFTIPKILRNNNRLLVKFYVFAAVFLGITNPKDFLKLMSFQSIFIIFQFLAVNIFGYLAVGDIYKNQSSEKLSILVYLLNSINLSTTKDLLKEANCYHRVYNLKINKKKIPQIIESKYILVPINDYNGDIKDVSLLQEHAVGTNKYVLSLASPKKALQPVFSRE